MTTKTETYERLLREAGSLFSGKSDLIANMANMAALLHRAFGFWWTCFYRVVDGELLLGPFQGPIACVHIVRGRGVCGTAWAEARTLVVHDVEKFPGHIACSAESKSEIVVPLFRDGEVIAVLDIDSERLATFDDTDRHYLERLVAMI